jgi:hypothetical protein
MYNGWIARTIDSGISSKIFRKVPCALMQHDWLDRTKPGFCIDARKCDLDFNTNAKKAQTELCFSFGKGPRNYVYIREDLLAGKKKIKVALKKDTEVKKEVKAQKKVKETKSPKVVSEKKVELKSKECPEGKILNPKTGRCVDVNGKIGKEILKGMTG